MHPVRSCGLGPPIDRALRDIINHRGKVVRFDVHDDVPERGPHREVHDPDKGSLFAQTHRRNLVASATGEKLPACRVADPLIPNPLSKPSEAVRRPGQSASLRFDPQIRKKISKRRRHRFRCLRRTTRSFDPDPKHTVPIRHPAFNFLDQSSEDDEGFFWTSPP